MKNAFGKMMRGVLAGGLLLMTACGGVEETPEPEGLQQGEAALESCRNDARQFPYCVHQMNLLGLATCQANEYRASYSLLASCSASTYHTITWVCCTQQ